MTEEEKKKLIKDLEKVVCNAAASTQPFVGTGKKEAGDQAAVDAMRQAFEGASMDAVVRVGEGEKDEAPMLYVGEKLGSGIGPKLDIAVDPVEGTALMASGKPNAIAVVAATNQDGFWDAGSAYYMNKIVVGPKAKGAIDITKSVAENLDSIAVAYGKSIEDLVVYVLDKPRHQSLVKEILSCGAKVDLHPEGDVIGSILALLPGSGIDVLMGIGGAPEAVITAAAVLALDGDMQGRLSPQREEERIALLEEGADLDGVLLLPDLLKCEWAVFAAAGVTSGLLLDRPKSHGQGQFEIDCLTISPEAGLVRSKHYSPISTNGAQ